MNKQEIKTEYAHLRRELTLRYRAARAERAHAYQGRRLSLKYQRRAVGGEERRRLKQELHQLKRDYKKEKYLQKSIFLEKRNALKAKEREALGSMVRLVTEHTPESLAGSMTLSYILIFIGFAVLQGALVTAICYYSVNTRAENTVKNAAVTLQAAGLDRQVAEVLADEYDMNVSLFRENGAACYSVGLEELVRSLPYNQVWDKPFSYRVKAETVRVYSIRVMKDGERYSLNLAKDMSAENALLSMVINALLFSIAVAGSLSYLVGSRVTRKLLRPIGVLGRAMEEMDAARLSDRLDTTNIRTELLEVVESYNRMLDKIEDAYERQKRFVSDASHELRTPLAVISGYSDILSRWGTEDPAVTREAVDAIMLQTASMQTLIERLLFIARSDNGTLKPETAETPLAPLCEEVLNDFKMIHPDRAFTLAGAAAAFCDAAMARQALVILLDNAVKYSPAGSGVAVRLYTEGDRTTIEVADHGVGMEPEVAAHIFERFYRADRSHSKRGYGLGLSIAYQMMQLQNGSITVETALGAGSTFKLIFPANGK